MTWCYIDSSAVYVGSSRSLLTIVLDFSAYDYAGALVPEVKRIFGSYPLWDHPIFFFGMSIV